MRILVCDGIAEEAIRLLREEHEVVEECDDLLEAIGDFDALIVRGSTRVTAEVLERGKRLKVVGRAGVGVDNIDVEKATELRIPVVNAPTGATVSVAELTLGLMLSLARHIPAADASVKEGKWLKKVLKGTELHGKVLGLVGIGRIGAAVAERARAFGMKVIAYDPYLTEEQVASHGAKKVELDDLLAEADFISIHVPLLPSTRGMFDMEKFRKMKRTAYIINCARGGVINEKDLVEALKEGVIAGAGLDVFENEPPTGEILKAPNTVFTPHLGASTVEGQRRAGLIVAEQVLKVLRGEKPDFQVNRF